MAVLNRLACIPSGEECSILTDIQGTFEVWQPKSIPGATTQRLYFVNVDSRLVVCIRSDCRDVRFKFECLYLTVFRTQADDSTFSGERIAVAKNLQEAKVVLRAEWERPALRGEVPPHYEQVVQVRGELNDIPSGAPACISMVGVLFIGIDGGSQWLVSLSDDFPLSLRYSENAKEIRQFLSKCSAVAVDEVAGIRSRLSDWEKGVY